MLEFNRKLPTYLYRNRVEQIICGQITVDPTDRFHNTFFHEICPLLVIAEFFRGSVTHLQHTGGPEEKFDGWLYFSDGRRQKVEMTAAIDGHQEALRDELLEQRGCAPAFQRIDAKGNKRRRCFSRNETLLRESSKADEERLLPLFQSRIYEKTKKSQSGERYTGAWLGVIFDDWSCPFGKKRKKAHFDPICRMAIESASQFPNIFPSIFFIGISRQYLFHYYRAVQIG